MEKIENVQSLRLTKIKRSLFSSRLSALGKSFVLSYISLRCVQAQTTRRNSNCPMYALCSALVDGRSVESSSTCADVAIVHSPPAKHPIIDTLSPHFTFNRDCLGTWLHSDMLYEMRCVGCVGFVNLIELRMIVILDHTIT